MFPYHSRHKKRDTHNRKRRGQKETREDTYFPSVSLSLSLSLLLVLLLRFEELLSKKRRRRRSSKRVISYRRLCQNERGDIVVVVESVRQSRPVAKTPSAHADVQTHVPGVLFRRGHVRNLLRLREGEREEEDALILLHLKGGE